PIQIMAFPWEYEHCLCKGLRVARVTRALSEKSLNGYTFRPIELVSSPCQRQAVAKNREFPSAIFAYPQGSLTKLASEKSGAVGSHGQPGLDYSLEVKYLLAVRPRSFLIRL